MSVSSSSWGLGRAAVCDCGTPWTFLLPFFGVLWRVRCALDYDDITKTCLYNFDPLKPHFYIVKLGFTGVNIMFLISAQNINCMYSLEPPRRGGSNEYPQSVLSRNRKKYQVFLSDFFQFLEVKFSIYLNRRVFVMISFSFGKRELVQFCFVLLRTCNPPWFFCTPFLLVSFTMFCECDTFMTSSLLIRYFK